MSVEDLDSSKSRVENYDACGSLANKPVAAANIDRLSIQSIRMDGSFYERKPREYGKACTQSAANMRQQDWQEK